MTDLNRFLADATSGYWWISVVLVSFIVNLASSYFKPFLDATFSRISSRRQAKIAAQRHDSAMEASILRLSTRLLILKGFEEIRWFVLSVFFLIVGLALGSLGSHASTVMNPNAVQAIAPSLLYLLGFLFFALGLWAFQRASDVTLVLLAARQATYTELMERGSAPNVDAQSL